MNDAELVGKICNHSDSDLKFLYTCYKDRNFPRAGLVIRLKNREFKERIAGKKIKVVGEDKKFFGQFLKHASPSRLEELETKIAKSIGVQDHKVVVVPTLTPWRFVPEST